MLSIIKVENEQQVSDFCNPQVALFETDPQKILNVVFQVVFANRSELIKKPTYVEGSKGDYILKDEEGRISILTEKEPKPLSREIFG